MLIARNSPASGREIACATLSIVSPDTARRTRLLQSHAATAIVAARMLTEQVDPGAVERIDHLVRDSTTPRTVPTLASMRWIVGSETPASSASVLWSMPSNARAARIWNDVITRSVHMQRRINDASSCYNDVKNIILQARLACNGHQASLTTPH
jgi:hypothetical protein